MSKSPYQFKEGDWVKIVDGGSACGDNTPCDHGWDFEVEQYPHPVQITKVFDAVVDDEGRLYEVEYEFGKFNIYASGLAPMPTTMEKILAQVRKEIGLTKKTEE